MAHRAILLKINSLLPALSDKEKTIGDFILNNPKRASHMTIVEISSELGVADSTVFKFTKKLGYSGFRDFRTELLAEEYDPNISINEAVTENDTMLEVAQKVFRASEKSISDTLSMLSGDDLQAALELLLQAKRMSFFGCGESAVLAMDAYHKFMRSSIPCQTIMDSHIQLIQASLLGEGDVAFVITHSGLTREMIEIARLASEANAKVIVITSYPSKKITRYADITFVSTSEETAYRSESLASRYPQLAIIDSLYTSLMFHLSDSGESLHKMRAAINLTKEEDW